MDKKTILFFVLALLLFPCCKNAPDYSTEEIVEKKTDYFHPKENEILISAHRGGSGIQNYPENSLETMKYLSEKGINLFEIDIMKTADGKLMLFHDSHLGRTTTGEGKVEGKTSVELLKYNLVDDFGKETGYKMPFLKDVLTWGRENKQYFMIDFKSKSLYQDVVNLIRDEEMQKQVALISYTTSQAKKLYQLAPDMMISVSARNQRELEEVLKLGIPTEKMLAFTGTRLSSQELYDNLKSKKIPINLGTLGNLDKRAEAKKDSLYLEWKKMGVNIFSTNRPQQVYKIFYN